MWFKAQRIPPVRSAAMVCREISVFSEAGFCKKAELKRIIKKYGINNEFQINNKTKSDLIPFKNSRAEQTVRQKSKKRRYALF